MKKEPKIHSRYNSNEMFTFEKTPNKFESVTEESIKGIKNYCADVISDKYTFEPNTLYPMVRTIMGNFDLLKSKLRQDYISRRGKMKRAEIDGIERTNKKLIEYKMIIDDYNQALKRFNMNLVDFGEDEIKGSMGDQEKALTDYENRLKQVEEKNHEA